MRFFLILLLFVSTYSIADSFPITTGVEVTKLEVWPSNAGVGRYSAYVKDVLPSECPNNTGFNIEVGPGAEAAYSTLLAATAAGKQIEIYLVRCEYFPVADRIRIIP